MLFIYIPRTIKQQIKLGRYNSKPDCSYSRIVYIQIAFHSQLISADRGDDINQSHKTTLKYGGSTFSIYASGLVKLLQLVQAICSFMDSSTTI